MHQQRGFTLIELIIVIVILGILAVTAAPRFIDLQGDANRAALKGAKAALKAGAQLVYAKATIVGQLKGEAVGLDLDGDGSADIQTDYGYPRAQATTTSNLSEWFDADVETDDTGEFKYFALAAVAASGGNPARPAGFSITPSGTSYTATVADACQVVYFNATATEPPRIELQAQGC